MIDKSDDKVGHLNTVLDRGRGNLNDPIFKSSNARALPGGGGGVEVDRRISSNPVCHVFQSAKFFSSANTSCLDLRVKLERELWEPNFETAATRT